MEKKTNPKNQAKKIDPFKMPIPESIKNDVPTDVAICDFEAYIKHYKSQMKKYNHFPLKYTQYHMLRYQDAEVKVFDCERRLRMLKYILSKNASLGGLKLLQDKLLYQLKYATYIG